MPLQPLRLNARIVVVVSCILLVTGATSGWITARNQAAGLMATMRTDSAVMVRSIAESCAHYMVVQDYAGLETTLLKSAELSDIRRLQVSAPDGVLIWDVERSPGGQVRAKTGIARIDPPESRSAVIGTENDLLVIWQPIVAGSTLGWIKAEFSLSGIREARTTTLENALLMAMAWVFLSAVLIIVVLRPTVKSIGKLSDFAKQLDDHKGAQIAVGRQPLEITELGQSLNQASAQLFSTERQLLEERERLRESEEKFRQVSAGAQDAIIVLDQDGRITDWNAAAQKIFGYSAAETIGRDMHALITPERHRVAFAEGLPQFRQTGTGAVINRTLEMAALNRDGAEFPVELSISSTMLRGQWHAIGIVRDITERKRAEAMRVQLAAIVQSSHDAIIGKDLEGTITSWNPGAEKVYGYRAEEVVGQPISILAPEGRKDETIGLLERIGRGEDVLNFETERFRNDGRRIDVALDMSPIRDASGRIVGSSTIARDITEKKQAERTLRKLNRALKVLSNCNQALIHATDEMRLLNEICQVIVDIGGYRLAWVGYAVHDAQQSVKAVAQSSYEPGLVDQAGITWADNERGRGPLGIAIRSGEIQVVQDTNTDPSFEPWRGDAARLGNGSVLVAPIKSDSKVIGALNIYAEGVNAFDAGEIALLSELAADMAFGIVTLRTRGAHERSSERLQRSMEATIQVIADTVEMRDPYTAGHQRRVAELAQAIAQDMGLPEDQVRGIHLAGAVHDLGKIRIPAEVLTRPTKLTRIEYEMIKSHSGFGYDILKGVDFPWPIAQVVLQHHERIDGSGYPGGLKGEEILLEARILAVADVVEAMASYRPYRPALGIEPALEEISRGAGKIYDAIVARVCLALFRDKGFTFKA